MSEGSRLRNLAGVAGFGVGVALWVIEASIQPPLWLRATLGGVAVALVLPWLTAILGRFVKRWRRGSGFYRFVDAAIAEADEILAMLTAGAVPSYPALLQRYRDWEHRAWSGALSYKDKYGSVVREWYESEVVANRESLTEWITKKRDRLRAIRQMGPPLNG